MKKKYAIIIPSLALLIFAIAGTVSAYGGGKMGKNIDPAVFAQRFDEQMTEQAGILGITVDEMKNAWASGKNLKQIAEEKGVDQEQIKTKMEATREEQRKQHMQILVSQGKITQAQADAHLQATAGKGGRGMGKGMGGRGQGDCLMNK